MIDEQMRQLADSMDPEFDPRDDGDLARLDNAMTDDYADRVVDTASGLIQQAYTAGTDQVLQGANWYLNRTDRRAVDWLREDLHYWVGQHWGTNVSTTIRGALDEGLRLGERRTGLAARLRDALDAQFQKSEAYWDGMANHVVTRARSFGVVEGMVRAGATYYRLNAVRDRRTSPTCRALHGRVFTVRSAVALRDRLIGVEDPEKIKDLAPWPKAETIAGKATGDLPQGLRIPPFHWLCRTTLEIWTDEGMPKGVNRDDWSAATELVKEEGFGPRAADDVAVLREGLARFYDGSLRFILDRTGPGLISGKQMPHNGESMPGRLLAEKSMDVYNFNGTVEHKMVSIWGGGTQFIHLKPGGMRHITRELDLQTTGSQLISEALGYNRTGTLLHEMGHAFRFQAGLAGFNLIAKYQKYQATGPTWYARNPLQDNYPGEEFFAECFSLYLVGRKSLKRLCPKGHEMIEEFIAEFGLQGHIRTLEGKDTVVVKSAARTADDWYPQLAAIRQKHIGLPGQVPTAGQYRAMLKEAGEFMASNPEWADIYWQGAFYGSQGGGIPAWLDSVGDDAVLDEKTLQQIMLGNLP